MTSLMDQEYLAFLDMWIHLTLHPGVSKDEYLMLDRPFVRPLYHNNCHACDVACVLHGIGNLVDCEFCPLEFTRVCGNANIYDRWVRACRDTLSLMPGRADRVRLYSSEILMTRWRRK
jgi:hypothetical protein